MKRNYFLIFAMAVALGGIVLHDWSGVFAGVVIALTGLFIKETT